MKILLVVFQEKFHVGQFDLFRLYFTVSLGIVKIEPGHCYHSILNKQSGHDFLHDYYLVLKQSGHDYDP